GPNHQHIFCVRLDMMVDGSQNTVYECDSVALPPGPENPYGNAWVVRQTPLRRESEAQRVADGRAARYWKITNPGRRNAPRATGKPQPPAEGPPRASRSPTSWCPRTACCPSASPTATSCDEPGLPP